MGLTRKCKACRRESQSSEDSQSSNGSKNKRPKLNGDNSDSTASRSSLKDFNEISFEDGTVVEVKKLISRRSEESQDSFNIIGLKRKKLKSSEIYSDSFQSLEDTIHAPSTSKSHLKNQVNHPGSSNIIHIMQLPTEVLQRIFKFLPFENVGKIRLVSRYFNELGSAILNSEFQRVRSSMQQRFQQIKAQMPRRESARRKHKLAHESDIVETMHMRLTLLYMTFGKHIERKHCCFFAGEILDEVYRIIQHIKNTPNITRAYKVTDELYDLSSMCMEFFKERIEPTLPEITYITTDFYDYTPSFSLATSKSYSLLEDSACRSFNLNNTVSLTKGSPIPSPLTCDTTPIVIPPSVQKKLRNLRDSVKRNNGEVAGLKKELRIARRRMTNQQKQIHELKARYEDYDKKFQNTSQKMNILLQELSRCKNELNWRSKSPAVSSCFCGKVTPINELAKDISRQEKPLENDEIYLDHELEFAFPDEFKPIPINESFENALSNNFSDSTQPPILVVPACHSFSSPIASTKPSDSEDNVIKNNAGTKVVSTNKPLTRAATKRILDMSQD